MQATLTKLSTLLQMSSYNLSHKTLTIMRMRMKKAVKKVPTLKTEK
jgi:hypothetical protein